jgi:phage repressor protein C with HTH and peptisase S24 domain
MQVSLSVNETTDAGMIRRAMNTIGRRIRYVREVLLHVTQNEFAARLGITRGAVGNWERDKGIKRENLVLISEKIGVDYNWLSRGLGPAPTELSTKGRNPQPNATVAIGTSGDWPSLPVYGQAVAGVHGEFPLNGDVLYTLPAPPNLQDVSDAYGVRVSGDSMQPRYEDGEVVFVNPRLTARRGDYVVAQIQTEPAGPVQVFVKRFVRINTEELVLSQFDPPKELTFPGQAVRSVHVIRGSSTVR